MRRSMSRPALVILGYSEAAMFLRGSPAPQLAGVISIHGAREHGVEATPPKRLDLRFDDVDVAAADDADAALRAWGRRRWAEQNGLAEVPPTMADVAAIVRFAEGVRDAGGMLLCHCGG